MKSSTAAVIDIQEWRRKREQEQAQSSQVPQVTPVWVPMWVCWVPIWPVG
ncbi:MAG: hypothetical protein AB2A00_21820 [Myxococcota bacterium]